ncbi:cytochrome P450 [Allokutzneria sp. A3M-2-11 16]|uniref:cytochrome P450 n=1 Tax=Allokutzneria sp. A3M-2-11 16 TaxID=2962043 RepID=UPI0020B89EB9|nr:cytochrome P450 [Allokutzneria sp. A3M-2-11 16]MCP3801338.1 cytochrome P450 [Allokutzneria sp. A3M-2-11 16]
METAAISAPVAPGRLFLAGHALSLWRKPLEFFRDLARHGDVVRIGLGPRSAYVVTDPDVLHQMLITDAESFKQGLLSTMTKPLIGESSSTLSGEEHRKRRRMLAPAFRQHRVNGYTALMSGLSAERAAGWREGEPIALKGEMNDLALTTVVTALMAAEANRDAAREIRELLPVFLKGLFRRLILPGFLLDLIPTKGNRGFTTSARRLREIITEAISTARADATDRGDVLSILIGVRDEETGDRYTDTQIVDELMALILAGAETTGSMLTLAFQNLAHDPGGERRLHAELDEVLGGRPPTAEDIPRLVFLQRVVDETLRMYAPWMLTRQAATDTVLGGVRIPKNAFMVYSPHLICRDERWYPDPHRWDPDRWAPERIEGLRKRAWVPFGGGAHICPGNIFARVEMIIHIATIASRWQLRPETDAPVAEIGSAALVHPADTPVIPVRRGNS